MRKGDGLSRSTCAYFSDGMFEHAIFGHLRGAFSGAVVSNAGYCEGASGGSLFLDGIGALGLTRRTKLLRVVDTKMYRKVGAAGRPILRLPASIRDQCVGGAARARRTIRERSAAPGRLES